MLLKVLMTLITFHLNWGAQIPALYCRPGPYANTAVTASSLFGNSWEPMCAFDGNIDTPFVSGYEDSFPKWLQIHLPSPIVLKWYTIYRRNKDADYTGQAAKDWLLLASNNEIGWTTIDIETNVPFDFNDNFVKTIELTNSVPYSYYRWVFQSNYGFLNTISIWEMIICDQSVSSSMPSGEPSNEPTSIPSSNPSNMIMCPLGYHINKRNSTCQVCYPNGY